MCVVFDLCVMCVVCDLCVIGVCIFISVMIYHASDFCIQFLSSGSQQPFKTESGPMCAPMSLMIGLSGDYLALIKACS